MKFKSDDIKLDAVKQKQEDEYSFPYHYVARKSENGFIQCYNDSWGVNYLSTVEYLLEELEQETFFSIVDIGCGDGRFTAELMKKFPCRKIVGLDFSQRAIALASAMTPMGDFRCVDITKQSVEELSDILVLMEVYEHINPNDAKNFRTAVAKLLKPGGILYLTVPHVNKALESKHYRHFTSDMLLLEFSPDFEILELTFIERKSGIKSIIDLIMTNRLFVLNNQRIGGWLYAFYKRHLFLAETESACQRMILRARKRLG